MMHSLLEIYSGSVWFYFIQVYMEVAQVQLAGPEIPRGLRFHALYSCFNPVNLKQVT